MSGKALHRDHVICLQSAEPGREEGLCQRLSSLLKFSALVRVDALISKEPAALLPRFFFFLLASRQSVRMAYFDLSSFLPTDASPIPSLAEQVLQVQSFAFAVQ